MNHIFTQFLCTTGGRGSGYSVITAKKAEHVNISYDTKRCNYKTSQIFPQTTLPIVTKCVNVYCMKYLQIWENELQQ